jgi:hypothetical protein
MNNDQCSEIENDCNIIQCEPKCFRENCAVEPQPYLMPEEIHCLYKDAVVQVHSAFVLLGAEFPGPSNPSSPGVTGANSSTPLAPNFRHDVVLEGNGFFIKGHYIVCPAHVVLLPPSLTSVANRFPFFDRNDLTLGVMKNQMIRASRILVSIFNVNGKGCSYIYEASLVGVDGAGDLAVLKINEKKNWNKCNPCIEKCHPFFTFGSSRAARSGEKIYLLGDFLGNKHKFDRTHNSVGSITEGIVSNHRYVDHNGWVLPETVLVSAGAYSLSSGLPIIDSQGLVIGMQTTDLTGTQRGGRNLLLDFIESRGSGFVAGPSEKFIRRIIKHIIRGKCGEPARSHLETVRDPVGSYVRFRKGYAGIGYRAHNGISHDSTTDYTSGDIISTFPRLRLDESGDFVTGPGCKDIIGIEVLGVAGVNPQPTVGVFDGVFYVPGGVGTVPFPASLPVSPFSRLQPGDIITHLDEIPIGHHGLQVSPAVVTWRRLVDDQIDVAYKRKTNVTNAENNGSDKNNDCYDILNSIELRLEEYPLFMDYPWYAVDIFPLMGRPVYPAFAFPANQILNPQIPEPTTPGVFFHPAF